MAAMVAWFILLAADHFANNGNAVGCSNRPRLTTAHLSVKTAGFIDFLY